MYWVWSTSTSYVLYFRAALHSHMTYDNICSYIPYECIIHHSPYDHDKHYGVLRVCRMFQSTSSVYNEVEDDIYEYVISGVAYGTIDNRQSEPRSLW